MIIAQISDTHISVDLPESKERLDDLRRTVEEINRLDPQPDVVIHTGDLANRGKAQEYAAALALLGQLHAPFYAAVGNRDDRALLREVFVSKCCFSNDVPFVQYAIDDHSVHLLVLDTQGSDRKGDYCEARAAGLLDALSEVSNKPVAVFFHHPPFDIPDADEPYQFQFESHEAANRLIDTLANSGQVVRVFCGHAHRDTKTQMGGIPASTIPSIAVDLRVGDSADASTSAPRFHLHHYDPQGGFTTVVQQVTA